MEVSDSTLCRNRDWDPNYLKEIFNEDFYDFTELWGTSVMDTELLKDVEQVEKYCPVVEDISLDDDTLCSAVENIEKE